MSAPGRGERWAPPSEVRVGAPGPAALKVVCAWCGAVIQDGPGPAEISHGICASCKQRDFGGRK